MEENLYSNIGVRITKFRKLKGWSQQELADRLAMNRSSITHYENGNVELNLNQISQIANVMGLTLLDFILDPAQESSEGITRELNKEELAEKIKRLEIQVASLKRELSDKDKMLTDKNKIIALYEESSATYKQQIQDLTKKYLDIVNRAS